MPAMTTSTPNASPRWPVATIVQDVLSLAIYLGVATMLLRP